MPVMWKSLYDASKWIHSSTSHKNSMGLVVFWPQMSEVEPDSYSDLPKVAHQKVA